MKQIAGETRRFPNWERRKKKMKESEEKYTRLVTTRNRWVRLEEQQAVNNEGGGKFLSQSGRALLRLPACPRVVLLGLPKFGRISGWATANPAHQLAPLIISLRNRRKLAAVGRDAGASARPAPAMGWSSVSGDERWWRRQRVMRAARGGDIAVVSPGRWINGSDGSEVRVLICQGGAAPVRLEGVWGQQWSNGRRRRDVRRERASGAEPEGGGRWRRVRIGEGRW
jgi:hypothetical protein